MVRIFSDKITNGPMDKEEGLLVWSTISQRIFRTFSDPIDF